MTVSKSHVANRNRRRGLKNIARKIRIMKTWIKKKEIPWKVHDDGTEVRDAKGERVLDWYPQKLEHFLNWTGEQNCSQAQKEINPPGREALRTTRHDVIKSNPVWKDRIQSLIDELGAIADQQLSKANKSNLIKELQAELEREKRMRMAAEQRYQSWRRDLKAIKAELAQELISHQQDNKQSSIEIDLLEAENKQLRSTNAALIEELNGYKRFPRPAGG